MSTVPTTIRSYPGNINGGLYTLYAQKQIRIAMDKEDVDTLRCLLHDGIRGDQAIFTEAILIGNVKIIELLLKNKYPHPRDEECLIRAINRGNVDVFKCLLKAGFAWTDDVRNAVASRGKREFLELSVDLALCLSADIVHLVIMTADKECLQFLKENKCEYDFRTLSFVCELRNLELLKFLHENLTYADDEEEHDSIYNFVYNLDTMRYLYEVMGFREWDELTFSTCVYRNDMSMLEYLYEKGCPMNTETSNACLDCANVDIIKFLHEHGCPFEQDVDFTDSPFDDNVMQYYHDHIKESKECDASCKYCKVAKSVEVWDMWELMDVDYQNAIQWFPKEMVEDVLQF